MVKRSIGKIKAPTIVRKVGASPEQQEIINYAYEISKEINFIYTLEAENGTYGIHRVSKNIGANGYRDVGLCQLNRQYHSPFIDSDEFNDYRAQIRYCWAVWQDAVKKGRLNTTFYGYNNIHKTKLNFEIL